MPSCGYIVGSQRIVRGGFCVRISTTAPYSSFYHTSLWVNTIIIHVLSHVLPTRYSRYIFIRPPLLRDELSTLSTPLTISTTQEKERK